MQDILAFVTYCTSFSTHKEDISFYSPYKPVIPFANYSG